MLLTSFKTKIVVVKENGFVFILIRFKTIQLKNKTLVKLVHIKLTK